MFPVRGIRAAGLVLVAALMLTASIAGAADKQTYSLTGDHVAIYNLMGEVEVVAGSGSEVQVELALDGPDADELRVEVGEIKDRETLRVIYPGKKLKYREMGWGSSTQIRVREDGTFGGSWGRSGRKVKISSRGSGLEAYADMIVRVPAGKRVAVYQAVGSIAASGVSADLRLDTAAAPVSAEDIKGLLIIDVGSGPVRVRGCEGDLDVDTGSGSINLADVNGARVNLDTGSGRVTGEGVVTTELSIDTGSGGINLSRVTAENVSLDTGSGSISIDLESDVDNVDIDTGSGRVTLGVPDALGAELRIETGSGGIDIEVPHETGRHRRSYFRGRLGDGDGRISIETGSGGVRVVGA